MMNLTKDDLLALGWMCGERQGVPDEWSHPVLGDVVMDFHTACEATRRGMVRDTSNQAEPWSPQPQDMAWQREHFDKLDDGAIWRIPASGAEFQVYPSEQRVVMVKGDPEQGPNDRIIAVTEAIGWTMEIKV